MDRREFFHVASALAASLAGVRGAGATDKSGPFAFLALGDIHFDRESQHDMQWLRQDHPNDVHQVENYSQITRESLPGLFQALRQEIADSQIPVRFVAQLGDLIEGMCGRPDLARLQCQQAVDWLRKANLGVPFLPVKGNHEVQGPGAFEAYNRILRPFVAEQADATPGPGDGASFAIESAECLLAFFDAYDRAGSLDWLEQTLNQKPAKTRHVFVLMHPPVVPYGARSLWHLYARPDQQAERQRLLDLLGRHHAIVLSAHLHRYGIVARKTDTGRFVQMALCSVLYDPNADPRELRVGRDAYGPDLVDLEPNFQPSTLEARRAALSAEAPFIEAYEYANFSGWAKIVVDGPSVSAQVHAGLDPKPWKTVDLTA